MKLQVVYEDNHLLAVVKPSRMPVVEDSSGDLSLHEGAKAYIKAKYNKPGEVFLGVVHRLDRPVSGIVLFARTSKSAARLAESWKEGEVIKKYIAKSLFSPGQIPLEGKWEQWLTKDSKRNYVKIEKTKNAKLAITKYKIIESSKRGALIQLQPVTGRSHQLRVACASHGLALQGDIKYGARESFNNGVIALHAQELSLPHPTKRDMVTFKAMCPDWFVL